MNVLFIVGEGVEELELIGPLDILRRAGAHCTVVGVNDEEAITGRNQVTMKTDQAFSEAYKTNWNVVVLPGGPSSFVLKDNEKLLSFLRELYDQDIILAAICAAPLILKEAGLLKKSKVTSHTSVKNEFDHYIDEPVLWDGNTLTSQGAGTSVLFGLALVERLFSKEVATEIAKSIEYK